MAPKSVTAEQSDAESALRVWYMTRPEEFESEIGAMVDRVISAKDEIAGWRAEVDAEGTVPAEVN